MVHWISCSDSLVQPSVTVNFQLPQGKTEVQRSIVHLGRFLDNHSNGVNHVVIQQFQNRQRRAILTQVSFDPFRISATSGECCITLDTIGLAWSGISVVVHKLATFVATHRSTVQSPASFSESVYVFDGSELFDIECEDHSPIFPNPYRLDSMFELARNFKHEA